MAETFTGPLEICPEVSPYTLLFVKFTGRLLKFTIARASPTCSSLTIVLLLIVRLEPEYSEPDAPNAIIAGFSLFGPCSMILPVTVSTPPFGRLIEYDAVAVGPSTIRLLVMLLTRARL